MKNRVIRGLFLLLSIARACATGTVDLTLTVVNAGTNDFSTSISGKEFWANPGSPYSTMNENDFYYPLNQDFPPNSTTVVTINAASSPFYGPIYSGATLSSVVYWVNNNSGPNWPGQSASSISCNTYSGAQTGACTFNASYTVYVNTNNAGAYTPCTTNVTVYLFDGYTNEILVNFTNQGVSIPPTILPGPLNDYPYLVTGLHCTNSAVSVTYSNIPPCMEPLLFNAVNTTVNWRIFAVGYNTQWLNTPGTSQVLLDESLVAPNGTYNYSNSVPCGQASRYSLFATSPAGDDDVVDTGITNMANVVTNQNLGDGIGSGSGSGGTGGSGSGGSGQTNSPPVNNVPPTLGSPTNYLPPVAPYTNGVVWQSTNTDLTQLVGVQQTSGNAIYNATVTAAQQAHSDASISASQTATGLASLQAQGVTDANGIIGAINNASALNHADNGTIEGDVNNVSANVAAGAVIAHQDASKLLGAVSAITNYNLETTQQKVLSALQGISNVLSQSNAAASVDTSGTNYGNYQVDASMTNAEAAQALASSQDDQSGITDFVNLLTPTLPPDTSPPVDMTMNFCGRVIDLDPVHMFPAAVAVSYNGFKVVALLSFFLAVGALYWKLITVKATTQTGGVPDMDIEVLGCGGNLVGFITGRICAFAFIAIFSAASAYIFANLGASISDAMNVAAFTNSLSAMALYLLTSFIPVRLMFSLACTLLVLNFTLAKIVGLAVSASRFLVSR